MNKVLDKTNGVKLVLENTAGQGNNLGYKFEHLIYIIDKVEEKSFGRCLYELISSLRLQLDMILKQRLMIKLWDAFEKLLDLNI